MHLFALLVATAGALQPTTTTMGSAVSVRSRRSRRAPASVLEASSSSPQEQVFAFASEIAISLIYGALAGVMSTMMMAGSVGEQEYLVKLAQLKVCSRPSGLPSPPLRARLTRNLWHVLRRG